MIKEKQNIPKECVQRIKVQEFFVLENGYRKKTILKYQYYRSSFSVLKINQKFVLILEVND